MQRLRKSGVHSVGDMAWGTHFCHFYETKQDLLDILIPYFLAGLENKELCIWVVFDALNVEEAKSALLRASPAAATYLSSGAIEIVPHSEWYPQGGAFDLEWAMAGWTAKLAQASERGYAGIRVNGNEAWLTKNNWTAFAKYEKHLNDAIVGRKMIVLCTYPLAVTTANELFDVARSHEFAIAKRDGRWEVLETSALKQAKQELESLSRQLEERVTERTLAIAEVNESLKTEIFEHKRTVEWLGESERRFRQLAENVREVFWVSSLNFADILYVSPTYEQVWGRTRESAYENARSFLDAIHPEDRPRVNRMFAQSPRSEFEVEYRVVRPDGSIRWIWDRGFPVQDQSGQVYRFAGIAEDITERKQAADRLSASREQLRALSASVQNAREEEGTRIAREIHDELGSALTSLKWDLEELHQFVTQTEDHSGLPTAQTKIEGMVRLTDTTINTIKRIASELRPSILDDLGLLDAVEWQAQKFFARSGIVCHCESALRSIDFNREQSTAVFRILQEALTNVLRHAGATRVDILAEEQGGDFILTIRDNGRGVTEAERLKASSLGLLGMQERAHLIGGKIAISGADGVGTTVIVRVPISGAKVSTPATRESAILS